MTPELPQLLVPRHNRSSLDLNELIAAREFEEAGKRAAAPKPTPYRANRRTRRAAARGKGR